MYKLTSLIFASLICLTPAVAQPTDASFCQIGGTWTIVHANGAVAEMDVIQKANKFTGLGAEGRNTGKLTGFIDATEVEFEIEWSNGHTGQYQGRVNRRQRFAGTNNDKADPTQQQLWFVKQRKFCSEAFD